MGKHRGCHHGSGAQPNLSFIHKSCRFHAGSPQGQGQKSWRRVNWPGGAHGRPQSVNVRVKYNKQPHRSRLYSKHIQMPRVKLLDNATLRSYSGQSDRNPPIYSRMQSAMRHSSLDDVSFFCASGFRVFSVQTGWWDQENSGSTWPRPVLRTFCTKTFNWRQCGPKNTNRQPDHFQRGNASAHPSRDIRCKNNARTNGSLRICTFLQAYSKHLWS